MQYNYDSLLSPAEVVKFLGGKICAQTLYKWRKAGIGPAWHRIGQKKVFYRFSDIEILK